MFFIGSIEFLVEIIAAREILFFVLVVMFTSLFFVPTEYENSLLLNAHIPFSFPLEIYKSSVNGTLKRGSLCN